MTVTAELAERIGLPGSDLTLLLRHVESICRRGVGQREPVAFLGPIYSYSYLAAVKHFGLVADLVPVTTIAAAFEELVRGQAKFGVVPIENSTDGRIVDTLGMFARSPVQICGEVLLPVHHCLLGRCSRAEVTIVQSKPQALSQCRNWLAQHVPDAKLVEVASTATAAARRPKIPVRPQSPAEKRAYIMACRSSMKTSRTILRTSRASRSLGTGKSNRTGHDKTSLMFQLNHQPGALAAAMIAFQRAAVNLTWIESFPLPNCPNEYLFFVELEGHQAGNGGRGRIERAAFADSPVRSSRLVSARRINQAVLRSRLSLEPDRLNGRVDQAHVVIQSRKIFAGDHVYRRSDFDGLF